MSGPDRVPNRVGERARAVFERVVEQRRDFHRHPELAYEEVRTSGKVIEWCRALGLTMKTGVGKTGVIATLKGAQPGRTIALRAGRRYDVIMEYADVSGPATARLSWSSPSQPKQVIPASQLTPSDRGSILVEAWDGLAGGSWCSDHGSGLPHRRYVKRQRSRH